MEADKTKFLSPLGVASKSIKPVVVTTKKSVQHQASNTTNSMNTKLMIKDKFDILKCGDSVVVASSSSNANNSNNKNMKKNEVIHKSLTKNLLSVSTVSVSTGTNCNINNMSDKTIHTNKIGLSNITNNNNKKDIMPSPAVLLAAAKVSKTSRGHITVTVQDTMDPDDRKKRCADRYDSSESSDR